MGKYVSHGCVRVHNKDVEKLYEKVQIGYTGCNYVFL
nr:L,D-transpeptidase family protein [Priestia aryabhattai]